MVATEIQRASLAKARARRMENLEAKKHQAAIAPPPPPQQTVRRSEEFLGLNNDDCCIDCTEQKCVVSQKPYCAHPRKCGLHQIDKANPKSMERYNRARKQLAQADLDRQP